jgi:hypothetical protein
MKHAVCVTVVATLVACTESNPTFQADKGGAGSDVAVVDLGTGTDGTSPGDDGPGPKLDTKPWPPDLLPSSDVAPGKDLYPWPDTTPWQCNNSADCKDPHACTKDSCVNNKCQNTLQPGFCLIGGACFKAGALHPQSSCAYCHPAASTVAWTGKVDGSPCAKDLLDCTQDVCKLGVCVHPLAKGTCLISGACYAEGDANPQNSCATCQPAKTAYNWSVAPNLTPCALDGKTCTADHCDGGVCSHPVNPGWCLIGNVCRPEGSTNALDPCQECLSKYSKSSWTFVAGKPCTSATGVAKMCVPSSVGGAATGCKGWTESFYQPPAALQPGETALNGVDYIKVAGGAWAAGEFTAGSGSTESPHGVLVPLGNTSPPAVTTKAPLRAIHHRMAVGDAGQAWVHDGTKWVANTMIQGFLKSAQRYSVHGIKTALGDAFYLGGPHDTGLGAVSGVVICSLGPISIAPCINHTGFTSQSLLGGIYATVAPLGAPGKAWAIHVDLPGNQPEDIYANSGGTSTSWNRTPPDGCQDNNNSPCDNTYGAFLDIYGSSEKDVWIVGSYGNMLHHDGSGWTRLQNKVQFQTYQVMKAVYSSPTAGLVSIASHRATGSTRWVNLYNYNVALDRWFGPIAVWTGSNNGVNEIRDIGGVGYNDLWMVGTKEVVSSNGTSTVRGWILHLK